MPTNITQLRRITKYYKEAGLPGCCGSMDVVHVKWSACPAGDHNHAKGKGGYPSLAFQCVTDFNRRILAVYGTQFGIRNDKEIVKDDPNVHYVLISLQSLRTRQQSRYLHGRCVNHHESSIFDWTERGSL
jgi:hypothetical protein